jgi:hypothetical protein
VIVKIHRRALSIRCGHDPQSVNAMLDRLAFLHCLHVFLLGRSLDLIIVFLTEIRFKGRLSILRFPPLTLPEYNR